MNKLAKIAASIALGVAVVGTSFTAANAGSRQHGWQQPTVYNSNWYRSGLGAGIGHRGKMRVTITFERDWDAGAGIWLRPARGVLAEHQIWCSRKYRSYDAASNTYLSYSGYRKVCHGPR